MCLSLGLKKPGDFTVSEGHGYPLVAKTNTVILADDLNGCKLVRATVQVLAGP